MKNQDEILKMRASLLSVLQAFKDGVDDAKLFKILYFAQREYLVKHDLVPSFIYKSLHMSKGRLDKEPNLGAFFADIQLVGI